MKKQEKNSYQHLEKLLTDKNKRLNLSEILFLYENSDFERKPCANFSEFIDSSYYLGIGEDFWQKARIEGNRIWESFLAGKINEAILLWGIGSGKSMLATLISLLMVQWLLCLKNPHKYFGLTNDKPIVVVNMGTTATQAKNVIFSAIRKFVSESPFFQEYKPEVLQTEIRFQSKNIALYSGNSQETMPIGLNVFCLILDEAAWYMDNENKSIAENIYNVGKNRIISRFGTKGFIMVISAVRYVDDFINRLYEKSKELDYVYTSRYKTWEIKDRNKMSLETFNFIVSRDKNEQIIEEWKDIPNDFKQVAEANPEKFMRDFGARPSLVLEAFDRDASIIVRSATNRESPVEDDGQLKSYFMATDSQPRYIHIDLGLKKDACGFAMGKANGYEIVDNERKVKIYIDIVLQIKAKEGGEIMFSDVRQLIYTLQDKGFKIAKVTFDGWQSIDSIQILKSRGIQAETLSVDRDTKAYDTMKEALHTKRFDCYTYEPLHKEYQRLELVKGKKVDHPQGGSKDVCDAVAGVCYGITQSSLTPQVKLTWI